VSETTLSSPQEVELVSETVSRTEDLPVEPEVRENRPQTPQLDTAQELKQMLAGFMTAIQQSVKAELSTHQESVRADLNSHQELGQI
jgi:hypothetical protein